jgi:hypothetical protein
MNVKTFAAAAALMAVAGTAQAFDYFNGDCGDTPIAQMTVNQISSCNALDNLRTGFAAAREQAYARMTPAHRQCYETADQTHLAGGDGDDNPRMQFVRECIAKADAAARAHPDPGGVPLCPAPLKMTRDGCQRRAG